MKHQKSSVEALWLNIKLPQVPLMIHHTSFKENTNSNTEQLPKEPKNWKDCFQ